jgi:hypothetical protein
VLDSKRNSIDQWITEMLIPQFNYNNHNYPLGLNQTMIGSSKTKEIATSLPSYIAILRKSPPAFAAQMVRALVLSQARFTFRYKTSSSTPRKQFGTPALAPLEQPWTNATTGELIARMEWDAGPAGNAFVTNWQPDRLNVLRPDWTAIVHGSHLEPEDPMGALDREVIGYIYQNGGIKGGNKNPIRTLRPSEVAHWSPIPDPLSPGLGMSWITPALRDIQGDNMMIEHKVKFFENGATPNLVIKGVPGVTPAQFDAWVGKFGGAHDGLGNAFRTMYLSLGMDATVVGSNLAELDFGDSGSYSETRITYLSRVPAALIGISAGLKGTSFRAGLDAETRRSFSDTWVYPTLQDLCAALSPMVEVPPYAELWFDPTDMPILREDGKVSAEIEQVKATTINAYITGGFTPESAVAAVRGQDISQLKHSGLVSVQLQPPGTVRAPSEPLTVSANGKPPAPNGSPALRSDMSPMQLPMQFTINVPERSIVIESPDVIVQPAEVKVEVPITVQPAEVTIPVTVQPATAPNVQIDAPVTVQPAAVTIQPPNVTVEPAVVNVTLPEETPSPGVNVEYDASGKVTGVTPKKKHGA